MKFKHDMKTNILSCTNIKGILKTKDLEIGIGNTSVECYVKANGKELKNVSGIWIKMLPDMLTKITIELIADFEEKQ